MSSSFTIDHHSIISVEPNYLRGGAWSPNNNHDDDNCDDANDGHDNTNRIHCISNVNEDDDNDNDRDNGNDDHGDDDPESVTMSSVNLAQRTLESWRLGIPGVFRTSIISRQSIDSRVSS